jgi:hypothetical protein
MSVHPSLDRESFQTLLASAFAVQESGINTQSLSALVEVQESIAKGEPDFDGILDLIADRARIVAGATGIAIGLLKADQLVYRAASGSAVKCVGRHVTAVLSVSAHKGARKEILRVENAETDARIEAAICRQRDAKALLIIPIYRERSVAGVMEVLFSDAHTFQDREMRTYRVMAGLVEDAMLRDIQLSQKIAPATQSPTVPHSVEHTASQTQQFCGNDTPAWKPSIAHVSGTAAQVRGKVPVLCPPAKVATAATQPLRRAFLDDLQLKAAVASVVIGLGLTCWIAFDDHLALTMQDSGPRKPTVFGQHVLQTTAKPSPASRAPKPHKAAGGTESAKAAKSAFKRVRVGPKEVDYIAEDVTIRRFMTKAAPSHVRGANKQFNIGDDVTVRYFEQKPEIVPQKRPVLTATQSVESSARHSK